MHPYSIDSFGKMKMVKAINSASEDYGVSTIFDDIYLHFVPCRRSLHSLAGDFSEHSRGK